MVQPAGSTGYKRRMPRGESTLDPEGVITVRANIRGRWPKVVITQHNRITARGD